MFLFEELVPKSLTEQLVSPVSREREKGGDALSYDYNLVNRVKLIFGVVFQDDKKIGEELIQAKKIHKGFYNARKTNGNDIIRCVYWGHSRKKQYFEKVKMDIKFVVERDILKKDFYENKITKITNDTRYIVYNQRDDNFFIFYSNLSLLVKREYFEQTFGYRFGNVASDLEDVKFGFARKIIELDDHQFHLMVLDMHPNLNSSVMLEGDFLKTYSLPPLVRFKIMMSTGLDGEIISYDYKPRKRVVTEIKVEEVKALKKEKEEENITLLGIGEYKTTSRVLGKIELEKAQDDEKESNNYEVSFEKTIFNPIDVLLKKENQFWTIELVSKSDAEKDKSPSIKLFDENKRNKSSAYSTPITSESLLAILNTLSCNEKDEVVSLVANQKGALDERVMPDEKIVENILLSDELSLLLNNMPKKEERVNSPAI